MDQHALKRKTITSVAWLFAGTSWQFVSMFIIFVVLTRLLTPRVFGIYALATVFYQATLILAMGGFGDAIIRQKDLDEELANTAFWANLLFSCTACVVLFFLAAPYANFTRQPEVAGVLQWLALCLPLEALATIHMARKLRDFGHKAVSLRTMAASTLGGVVAIAAAIYGFGVWSLVFQAWVGSILAAIFAWRSFRWIPRLQFSWTRLRPFLGFSTSIMVTRLTWLLLVRVQDLFIARSLGAPAVGSYRIAWRLIELIGQSVAQPIANVALATLSRIQDDNKRFQAAYSRFVGLAALGTFPMIFGFGILSHELIRLLFGSNWNASADIAQILVLMTLPYTLNYFVGAAMSAKGATHEIFITAVMGLILTTAMTYFAAPYGLAAVAAAYVLRTYITLPYQQHVLSRHAGIKPLKSLAVIAAPLIASICMVVVLAAVRKPLTMVVGDGALFVTVSIPLGVISYGAALLAFGRKTVLSHLTALDPVLMPLRLSCRKYCSRLGLMKET